MTMSEQAIEWREEVSRGTALALMSNFTSVADALQELVDNAIDFRWGQDLSVVIEHSKTRDQAVVESSGGRGMGAADIQEWLNWGAGATHAETDIGRYHQGGKAACGFLASQIRLYAKRRDEEDVWLLSDRDWGTRSEPMTFGEPRPLPASDYPITMTQLPMGRGHVRIELSHLSKSRRWNLEDLRHSLGSTYKTLLEQGQLSITVNGDEVAPLELPLSTAVDVTHLDVKLRSGRGASGWAGRLMRPRMTRSVRSGLRLLFNGRLIKDGEWFGYNWEGKGALNSLIGELHMSGFEPVLNKTDFRDRGDNAWHVLSAEVVKQLGPLIAELRRAGEESRVTKRERESVREVAEELQRMLGSIREAPPPEGGSSGAEEGKRPGPSGREGPHPADNGRHPNPTGHTRESGQARTQPPASPVGSLDRLLNQLVGGDRLLQLRVKSWDSSERASWQQEGKSWVLAINKNFPLYQLLSGSKPYLAETALMELCASAGQGTDLRGYVDQVNFLLGRWARVVEALGGPHDSLSGDTGQLSLA